jgi:DNA ligase D-like protein (predicted 3'-phosphoesterase)
MTRVEALQGTSPPTTGAVPVPRAPLEGDSAGDHPRYVVQQDDEASLHFDFSLEVDGMLRTWSVPLGPSVDPRERRMATEREPAPLERVNDGERIVWDLGHYDNRTEVDGQLVSVAAGVESGHVRVELHGEKLSGLFDLVHHAHQGGRRTWLMTRIDAD